MKDKSLIEMVNVIDVEVLDVNIVNKMMEMFVLNVLTNSILIFGEDNVYVRDKIRFYLILNQIHKVIVQSVQ